jgi:hypothetical protein
VGRPLRPLGRRHTVQIALPAPVCVALLCPVLGDALRRRALALEIEGERLAQLALADALAGAPPGAPPGVVLAGANLRRYWPFDGRDRQAWQGLLAAAFPAAAPAEISAALAWLED